MSKVLMIECCAECKYFEFVRRTPSYPIDRTYCNFYSTRIIPQTIDPSDGCPEWCPLPDWEKTFKRGKK